MLNYFFFSNFPPMYSFYYSYRKEQTLSQSTFDSYIQYSCRYSKSEINPKLLRLYSFSLMMTARCLYSNVCLNYNYTHVITSSHYKSFLGLRNRFIGTEQNIGPMSNPIVSFQQYYNIVKPWSKSWSQQAPSQIKVK